MSSGIKKILKINTYTLLSNIKKLEIIKKNFEILSTTKIDAGKKQIKKWKN